MFYKIIVSMVSPYLLVPRESLESENNRLGTEQRAGILQDCWRGK